MSSDQQILIGKILAPHGIGGQVRVYPYSDFPERVAFLKEVILEAEQGQKTLVVENASRHGRNWLIKFEEVNTRDEAENLRDTLIFIPREERMPLPEGYYYHDQLIGLEVYTEEGVYLGILGNVITNGAHDQLLVKLAKRSGKEVMIPAVKEFVKEIDLIAGKVIVSLPKGLLDL
ncbi:MAG: ribosome maturation factor RimM [Bacillota bacterium]